MNNRSSFFILIIFVALLSACGKDGKITVTPDPDEFNSDASALLNGEKWYAYMNWSSGSYIGRDTQSFSFIVTKDDVLREDLSFDGIPLRVGVYPISEVVPGLWFTDKSTSTYVTILEDGDVAGEFYDSSADTAFHFFALDKYNPVKQEVEGRFQVELIKDPSRDFFDTPDTLRFTNGRFKLRMR